MTVIAKDPNRLSGLQRHLVEYYTEPRSVHGGSRQFKTVWKARTAVLMR